METKPYLIFTLHDLQYGIDANLVQEIFLLPELAPIAEAPDDIVGILNLRSKLVPVMHLDLRLGYKMQECQLSDSAIVLEWGELQIGVIVNSVREVKNISAEAIEAGISYGRLKECSARFISGIAKVDADIIMLLNPEQLICNSVEDLLPVLEKNQSLEPQNIKTKDNLHGQSFYEICCPNATPQEKAIFRERAANLRRQAENSDFTELIPLAVFGLNGEYFGLDLEVVQEIVRIRNVTPIPCCPNYIVGNMNSRGEIVTLVDIRQALNLPFSTANTTSKAIVIRVNDTIAGISVDEVFDVMYLRPSDLTQVPVAVHSKSNEHLRGTALYADKMLSILDLPKILTEELAVNEEI